MMLLCSWGGLSVRVSTPKIQPTSLHWRRCQQLLPPAHTGVSEQLLVPRVSVEASLKQLLLPGAGMDGENLFSH